MNLEQMREEAGISQVDMAKQLGVSQSQVSRYEKNPDDMPLRVYKEWCSYCGDISTKKPLDVGSPMKEITSRVALIKSYIDTSPSVPESISGDELKKAGGISSLDALVASFERVARKPRVGLFGRFDMGKSRLANTLMGSDSLPSSYQPATSVACLIRHVDDKPHWQTENVWVMDPGFDLDQPNNEEHCKKHKLIGGGYETLREHGTHSMSIKKNALDGASSAIVYVDSDFLKGCDIIDLPGYGHGKGDDQRAEMAKNIVDVVIYASNVTNFMNESDCAYLGQLIEHLPINVDREDSEGGLSNLFIVATRADTANGEYESILDIAAHRAYDSIGPRLESRGKDAGGLVGENEFRSRFFTYSVEDQGLRKNFEKSLSGLLCSVEPKRQLLRVERVIKNAKSSNVSGCEKLINSIEVALKDRKLAQKEVGKVLEKESERIEKKNSHVNKIRSLISELEKESLDEAANVVSRWSDVDRLETVIKNRYMDKKSGKKLAPSFVAESMKIDINDVLQAKSQTLSDEVDAWLESYDVNVEASSSLSDQWSFNARGAFIGSLASLGTFGALAVWASAAAAGSNLGAYILIGQIVSALSSIGISLGGTGAVFSVIAALGGPITVGLGLAVAVGVIAAALLGDSWQRSLAKQIRKGMTKNNAQGEVRTALSNFWFDTLRGFNYAVIETENDYLEKLDSLRTIAFSTDALELESKLQYLKELRDFFAGIPWKAIS